MLIDTAERAKRLARTIISDIALYNRELIKNRAQGYEFVGGKLTNDAPLGMSQPGAAGALLSTGGDLVRWSQALTAGKVDICIGTHRLLQKDVVFKDLGLPNAEEHLVKAQLVYKIAAILRDRKLKQVEAGKIPPPGANLGKKQEE